MSREGWSPAGPALVGPAPVSLPAASVPGSWCRVGSESHPPKRRGQSQGFADQVAVERGCCGQPGHTDERSSSRTGTSCRQQCTSNMPTQLDDCELSIVELETVKRLRRRPILLPGPGSIQDLPCLPTFPGPSRPHLIYPSDHIHCALRVRAALLCGQLCIYHPINLTSRPISILQPRQLRLREVRSKA